MLLRDLEIMGFPARKLAPAEGKDKVLKGLRGDKHRTAIKRMALHLPSLALTFGLAAQYHYSKTLELRRPLEFLPSNILSPEHWCLALVLGKVVLDYAPCLVSIYRDTLFEHLYTDYVYYLNPCSPLAPSPVNMRRGNKLML